MRTPDKTVVVHISSRERNRLSWLWLDMRCAVAAFLRRGSVVVVDELRIDDVTSVDERLERCDVLL